MPMPTAAQYFSPPQSPGQAGINAFRGGVQTMGMMQQAKNQQEVMGRKRQEWKQADVDTARKLTAQHLSKVDTSNDEAFANDMSLYGSQLYRDMKDRFGPQADAGGTQLLSLVKASRSSDPAIRKQARDMVDILKGYGQEPMSEYQQATVDLAKGEAERKAGEVSYGPIKEGMDEKGKPVLYHWNKTKKQAELVEGFGPAHKAGEVIEVDKDGNVRISKGVKGRIIPAEQVGKIGEFKAYEDTIGEIENVIEGMGVGDFLTGPQEIVTNKLDNWGVLSNEKRMDLRALVARMPGLMYALRGKQLSDKELEVALKMMPRMEQVLPAFVVNLRRFNEYMALLRTGKLKAFRAAGYNADELMAQVEPLIKTKQQVAAEGEEALPQEALSPKDAYMDRMRKMGEGQ